MNDKTLGVYKFFWDCGRGGDLNGVFVAEKREIDRLMGQEIYFGEVLGKHSEVSGSIDDCDITLITTDQKVVKIFQKDIGTVGHNPLDYLCEERWWFDSYEEMEAYEAWCKRKYTKKDFYELEYNEFMSQVMSLDTLEEYEHVK